MFRQPVPIARRRHLAVILSAAMLFAACDRGIVATDPLPLGRSGNVTPVILDGAHEGNKQFYFLPPMVPPPNYSGTFDPSKSPVVSVCELTGATCGKIVATFSGSGITVDLAAQAYIATWNTKPVDLSPQKTYRIRVFLGTKVLGFADLVVQPTGSTLPIASKGKVVSIVKGTTLSIRFRIEGGMGVPGRWHDGDFKTYTQTLWDDSTSFGGSNLVANFPFVYLSRGGVVLVGVSGWGSMTFTGQSAVRGFLPQSGTPSRIVGNVVDPTTSTSGSLGGEALALALNVDFSDMGLTRGTNVMLFGDLTLCGLGVRGFNGMTVREFLAASNLALTQAFPVFTFAELATTAAQLNASFADGVVSQFAQDHLLPGNCPGAWKNGDVITYSQESWGGDPTTSPAAALVNTYFDVTYPGGLEVGINGSAGYSMAFTSGPYVVAYLPGLGAPGPLNADLVDPTTTSSGAFGGAVLALQLNLDFIDAGLLSRGAAGVHFGDLRVCDLTLTPLLSGQTVRQLLALFNQRLGGGTAPYSDDELHALAEDIGHAFEGGVLTSFARAKIVSGACN